MSSEFAASESTPLRQPDHQYNRVVDDNSLINNNNRLVSNNTNHHIVDTRTFSVGKMDNNTRVLMRVAIDFIILLCVGFPILFFYLWGEPYKRGFFCDDESLRHPFHDSTVKNWMLYIIGLALPILIILTTEFMQIKFNGDSMYQRYKVFDFEIPTFVSESYKQIGVFGFGAACSQLVTDIAKYTIGRFRPHFISVCDPIMPDGSNCSAPHNYGKYIEDFVCRSSPKNLRLIKEMRLSFPSGHSSFSAFTMVYCAIYLQSRMSWKGSKLLKHFLQFLLVMLAWYTALSRISDYKHHWSDALSGTIIGTFCALIVANYVSDLIDSRQRKYLPTTRQELTTIAPSPTANNGRV